MQTISDTGFRFFDLDAAIKEAEQEKRDMCASFGSEVYNGDVLILRMMDEFHWGLSFDEQLLAIQEAFNGAMENIGKKLIPVFDAFAKAFTDGFA